MKILWPITIMVQDGPLGQFKCEFHENGDCIVTNWTAGEHAFEGSRSPLRPSITTAMRLARKVREGIKVKQS